MDWLSWGVSWGLSWGESWGDVAVEEHPNRWAAGGVAKPRRGTVRPGVFRPRPAQPFKPSMPVTLPPRRKENDEALLLAGVL